jgi:hypothetical protein
MNEKTKYEKLNSYLLGRNMKGETILKVVWSWNDNMANPDYMYMVEHMFKGNMPRRVLRIIISDNSQDIFKALDELAVACEVRGHSKKIFRN